MSDAFANFTSSLDSPGEFHFAISPSDTDPLPARPRVLRVGTGGLLVLVDKAGVEVTYNVVDGEILPFRALAIRATGTTATNIVGWY